MKTFLFVCTGNTCRSPMAERFFLRLAREAGLDAAASSAGTQAANGMPLSRGAEAVFAKKGFEPAPHRARRVTAELVKGADRVYALETLHLDYLKKLFPGDAAKIVLLRGDAGLTPAEVEDPVGADALEYEACAASIEEALKIIVQRETKAHAQNAR